MNDERAAGHERATSDERAGGVLGVLDALAAAVESARSMPMSSSVLVNRAELLDLVDQARAALPDQLTEADELLADTEAGRAPARGAAAGSVAEARVQADRLVDAESVTVEARAKAAELVAQAQAQAEALRREADDYCDRRLADFEIDLGRVLGQVQAGRAKLAGRLGGPSD
jgi:cell division septum initiation protein DivIVA